MGKLKPRAAVSRAAGALLRAPRRLFGWMQNVSLRVCLFALTVLAVVCYIVSLAIVLQFTEGFMYSVYWYIDEHAILISQLPDELVRRMQIVDFVRLFATYFLALLYIFFEVIAFYNLKLKVPLRLLRDAASRMAHSDLGFTLSYSSRDELGELCRMFERTRSQLEENNRGLWRAIEERKRLNAAFAHDLRTPLTVLRGYVDFLAAYVPQGKIREEKLLSTLSTMSNHITRLEQYVDTMNEAQRLDDISALPRQVTTQELTDALFEELSLLGEHEGVSVSLHPELYHGSVRVDPSIVLRVADNLVSNALGYAESRISLTLRADARFLYLTVEDDGRGFTREELSQATKAFYKDKSHENSAHFGLGLNICQTLCERHGGWLSLENGPGGGARVTARFSLRSMPSLPGPAVEGSRPPSGHGRGTGCRGAERAAAEREKKF